MNDLKNFTVNLEDHTIEFNTQLGNHATIGYDDADKPFTVIAKIIDATTGGGECETCRMLSHDMRELRLLRHAGFGGTYEVRPCNLMLALMQIRNGMTYILRFGYEGYSDIEPRERVVTFHPDDGNDDLDESFFAANEDGIVGRFRYDRIRSEIVMITVS